MKKILCFILLIIFAIVSWTIYVYYHLDIGEQPQISDVIIVPGGQIYRETKAKELLELGYSRSNKVILSPISLKSKLLRKESNLKIVDPINIVVEEKSTSTMTNAKESIKVMEKNRWKSAIIVTSDFHMRRTRLAFERASHNKEISFTYVSAYPEVNGVYKKYLEYEPNNSWVKAEILKYWGYVLGLYDIFDLDD